MKSAPTMSSSPSPSAQASVPVSDGPLNVYKFRWLFIAISVLFLLPGLYFIGANMANPEIRAPLRLGIDFRGGTLLEYGFSKPVRQDDIPAIQEVLDKAGYSGSVVQIEEKGVAVGNAEEKVAGIVSIRSKQIQGQDETTIRQGLESRYGHVALLQKNSMGPALARELFTNGLLALGLAYLLIVGYLTFRFQFDFAVCAMVALLHDTLFLIGMFAIFGALFHTEVDSLFITAILTVVGFSVHDTIVVFDRIRENLRVYYTKKIPFVQIMNISVNQTLTRSINTSLTALLTMLALYFFGGETTRDFVLAIILGIAAGTYSSIFNASVLLAMWRNRRQSAAITA
jgi:preprotein translocase subunit SecF